MKPTSSDMEKAKETVQIFKDGAYDAIDFIVRDEALLQGIIAQAIADAEERGYEKAVVMLEMMINSGISIEELRIAIRKRVSK